MRMQLALIALAMMQVPMAQAAERRATVLLIPVDSGAFTSAAKYTTFLEEAISRAPGYRLRGASQVLGDPTPIEAIEARRRVSIAVKEGKKLALGGQFDDAEASLRSGLVDMNAAVAAMDRCAEYCDALAYLASMQQMKGEEQGAREALRKLLAINRGYKFEGPAFGKSFQILLRDVQRTFGREAKLGSVTIQTSPPGGMVYLNGEAKGYSPLTVERIPAGQHLLRIERPGAITYGQLLEVTTAEDSVARIRLTATPEYADLEELMEQIAGELESGQTKGKNLMRLGGKLKVERAMVGIVSSRDQRVRMDAVFVDFPSRSTLATRSHNFLGDEYGELDKEVRRFGNLLMSAADARPDPTAKASTDPLDRRTGMEDWDEEGGSFGEDRGGFDEPKPASRRPRPSAPEPQASGGEW